MAASQEALDRLLAEAIAQPIKIARANTLYAEQYQVSRSLRLKMESKRLLPSSIDIGDGLHRTIEREPDCVFRARSLGATDEQIRLLVDQLEAARGNIPGAPQKLKVAA